MYQVLAPFEAQLVEEDREHLEVVVLLIAYYVYHLVDRVVLKAQLCCSDVLGHIYRCAVRTQQEFFIKAFTCEISPYRAVISSVEQTLCQSFFHLLLAFKVGVAFVVYLVKRYTQRLVCLVKAGIYPFVHLPPQCTHLRVVLLPFYEHLVSLLYQRRLVLCILFRHSLRHEFLYLLAVVLVKSHVVVANKVVALLA